MFDVERPARERVDEPGVLARQRERQGGVVCPDGERLEADEARLGQDTGALSRRRSREPPKRVARRDHPVTQCRSKSRSSCGSASTSSSERVRGRATSPSTTQPPRRPVECRGRRRALARDGKPPCRHLPRSEPGGAGGLRSPSLTGAQTAPRRSGGPPACDARVRAARIPGRMPAVRRRRAPPP